MHCFVGFGFTSVVPFPLSSEGAVVGIGDGETVENV